MARGACEVKRSGGIDPAGDVTTGASLGDIHTPDQAAESHKAIGCFRYPHEGPCNVEAAKTRKVKR